jgi:hypothetical protein
MLRLFKFLIKFDDFNPFYNYIIMQKNGGHQIKVNGLSRFD